MSKQDQLAVNGGPKAKTKPFTKGERFGGRELEYLKQALEQNTLFYGFGEMVQQACERMKAYADRPYVVACSSGTAAVHLGLIAAGIGPGDEVLVTPNTDSGSVIGIIEEGAVPVFLDPTSNGQASAEDVEKRITERTKAVEVIHIHGYPAPVDEIIEVCQPRGVAVVEDCAQAWGAKLHGRPVGSFATAGCFSTNDFKHISAGDGGFIGLSDPELYRRVSNYADKHYDRLFDKSQMQKHHAMNYRMTELQGAVALAQLERADAITSRHTAIGDRIRADCSDLPGAEFVDPIPGGVSTYYSIILHVNANALTVGRDEIAGALAAEGLPASSYGRYDLTSKLLFQERIVRPWMPDRESRMYPFVQPDGREYIYSLEATPRHRQTLQTGIMVRIQDFYTDEDVDEMIEGFRKVFEAYAR